MGRSPACFMARNTAHAFSHCPPCKREGRGYGAHTTVGRAGSGSLAAPGLVLPAGRRPLAPHLGARGNGGVVGHHIHLDAGRLHVPKHPHRPLPLHAQGEAAVRGCEDPGPQAGRQAGRQCAPPPAPRHPARLSCLLQAAHERGVVHGIQLQAGRGLGRGKPLQCLLPLAARLAGGQQRRRGEGVPRQPRRLHVAQHAQHTLPVVPHPCGTAGGDTAVQRCKCATLPAILLHPGPSPPSHPALAPAAARLVLKHTASGGTPTARIPSYSCSATPVSLACRLCILISLVRSSGSPAAQWAGGRGGGSSYVSQKSGRRERRQVSAAQRACARRLDLVRSHARPAPAPGWPRASMACKAATATPPAP